MNGVPFKSFKIQYTFEISLPRENTEFITQKIVEIYSSNFLERDFKIIMYYKHLKCAFPMSYGNN